MAQLYSVKDNWVVECSGSPLCTAWVCFWTEPELWGKVSSSFRLIAYISWTMGCAWDTALLTEKGLFYGAAASLPGISP